MEGANRFLRATEGMGLSESVVSNEVEAFQPSLQLDSMPNPFHHTTTIRYTLPSASHVLVQVFDVRGRVLATLVNQNQAEGPHMATFERGSLSPGAYIFRLHTPELTISRTTTLGR